MSRECVTHHHACDCREAKFADHEREAEEQSRLIEKQAGELAELRQRIESAPVGILREQGGSLAEYVIIGTLTATVGKRVRLVVEDATP